MKLPNSYGSVIKLSGKRRKPYAVRISAGYTDMIVLPNKAACYPFVDKYNMAFRKGKNSYAAEATDKMMADLDKAGVQYHIEPKRKFKYLEYFEKSADAYSYLARMNSGDAVKEHTSAAYEPRFKDVYEAYIGFITSLQNKPSQASLRGYAHGYKLWSDLHDMRFKQITTQHLQKALSGHNDLSESSVSRMVAIARKMYKYALAHDICSEDKSLYLFAEYSKPGTSIHKPFTKAEIKKLWEYKESVLARIALVLIYTGMRAGEFLQLKNADLYLDQRYMIGGLKTDAGKNRVIPIHKRIVPIIEGFMSDDEYLFSTPRKKPYNMSVFTDRMWKPYFTDIGMAHLTHDCRHTCATLMESAGISSLHRKLILGHKVTDVTDGVYTHVSVEDLVKDIDLLE